MTIVLKWVRLRQHHGQWPSSWSGSQFGSITANNHRLWFKRFCSDFSHNDGIVAGNKKKFLSSDLENVCQGHQFSKIAVSQLYEWFLPNLYRNEGRAQCHKYRFNYFLLNYLVCSCWQLISFWADDAADLTWLTRPPPRLGVARVGYIPRPPSQWTVRGTGDEFQCAVRVDIVGSSLSLKLNLENTGGWQASPSALSLKLGFIEVMCTPGMRRTDCPRASVEAAERHKEDSTVPASSYSWVLSSLPAMALSATVTSNYIKKNSALRFVSNELQPMVKWQLYQCSRSVELVHVWQANVVLD